MNSRPFENCLLVDDTFIRVFWDMSTTTKKMWNVGRVKILGSWKRLCSPTAGCCWPEMLEWVTRVSAALLLNAKPTYPSRLDSGVYIYTHIPCGLVSSII